MILLNYYADLSCGENHAFETEKIGGKQEWNDEYCFRDNRSMIDLSPEITPSVQIFRFKLMFFRLTDNRKKWEFGKETFLAFINIEKAYDNINRQ
jgi:hypothetical protein